MEPRSTNNHGQNQLCRNVLQRDGTTKRPFGSSKGGVASSCAKQRRNPYAEDKQGCYLLNNVPQVVQIPAGSSTGSTEVSTSVQLADGMEVRREHWPEVATPVPTENLVQEDGSNTRESAGALDENEITLQGSPERRASLSEVGRNMPSQWSKLRHNSAA